MSFSVFFDRDKMGISLPGHSSPNAGFEVPLEMLAACHARIQSRCDTLRRLVPHLTEHGSDEAARSASAGLLRYFDTAARDHHADEEEDLFPALIESMAGSDAVCIRDLIAALAAEHRELELRWARVRKVLERIVAGDPVVLDQSQADALIELYTRHIEREESELLPMAIRLLGDDELERIGRSMRMRRGIGR
jgi:hemerythrin-like domain-containing protein